MYFDRFCVNLPYSSFSRQADTITVCTQKNDFSSVGAILLAAGEGTRMRSDMVKVLHPLCGTPMIRVLCNTLDTVGLGPVCAVVGRQAEKVAEVLFEGVLTAEQEKRLGTAHAVKTGLRSLPPCDHVLVIGGDTPLVRKETLEVFLKKHLDGENALSMLVTELDDPTGYGRIVRDDDGNVKAVVEEKEASPETRAIKEVNMGVYCFSRRDLKDVIGRIKNDNNKGEYYLTDAIGLLTGIRQVNAWALGEPAELMGINDRYQLSRADMIFQKRIQEKLMSGGVSILGPQSVYIEDGAQIAGDTVIGPNVYIDSKSSVEPGCRIGPFVHLAGTEVKKGTILKSININNGKKVQ